MIFSVEVMGVKDIYIYIYIYMYKHICNTWRKNLLEVVEKFFTICACLSKLEGFMGHL
jgi:hypothetical protein